VIIHLGVESGVVLSSRSGTSTNGGAGAEERAGGSTRRADGAAGEAGDGRQHRSRGGDQPKRIPDETLQYNNKTTQDTHGKRTEPSNDGTKRHKGTKTQHNGSTTE